jgi:hypothetical protein
LPKEILISRKHGLIRIKIKINKHPKINLKGIPFFKMQQRIALNPHIILLMIK